LLRKVFGSKEGDLTGEWRKQHNFELHELYFSLHPTTTTTITTTTTLTCYSDDQIRANETGRVGLLTYMAEERNRYAVSLWKPEGKGKHGKRSLRWKDNI